MLVSTAHLPYLMHASYQHGSYSSTLKLCYRFFTMNLSSSSLKLNRFAFYFNVTFQRRFGLGTQIGPWTESSNRLSQIIH